ncbi:serine/threonine-protein phosphatase [Phormidium sp. CLA17]|uniref:PP2C family protein-serine/threonine phosphatase n=1 Tax=Leptolyngbya sp. Cla-17 TaxID=2803751 RepID=UPI001491DFF6|nr:PP2C family serine/threonine-protein phosphatase [Leptolyngbya sp. Cla-17]MBM0741059.1 serine/threonine-protein phosphatase [Leptolyngbya sp. Cla-17]
MSSSKPQIYCSNLNCAAPLNDFGSSVCKSCQTPLIYRYLWAVGEAVLQIPVDSQVGGRYVVKAPQIWLDTQPGLQPDFPTVELPDALLPYLYLYPYRLHIPEVHGLCSHVSDRPTDEIFLLENVPLDKQGNLLPAIAQAWAQATAARQVYWLWQLLQLWNPLAEQGVSASLLAADNIRVEGWRVRLCQLFIDEALFLTENEASSETPMLGLADLANVWLGWIDQAKPEIAEPLQRLCQKMHENGAELEAIAAQLNQLLLEQTAQLPLRLQIASATDPGPQHDHNEDTCYPDNTKPNDGIFPRLVAVCDGIGGHEGGEVASQLAVQSLKLQIQALLAEVVTADIVPPEVVAEQIEAITRVMNDMIAAQNDLQGREARRRMGTTLVMALQFPQQIVLSTGQVAENSHELYLVNVGDSRAYWLTPRYCHQLTVDDDVAAREVRMGRSLYREALKRPDSGSLIQALGTRDSEFLRPSIQRLLLEEDGILLLCSDGLSDNGWVESSWLDIMGEVFRGKKLLSEAAQDWVDLANRNNGHDNVSVVLLDCHVSTPLPDVSFPDVRSSLNSDWSESSRGLLQEADAADETAGRQAGKGKKTNKLLWIGLILATLLIGSGLAIWAQVHFDSQPRREQPTSKP